MALLFTLFCGGASISLGYFINYFAKGHFVESTEAILDMEIALVETLGVDRAAITPNSYLVFLDEQGHIPNTSTEDVKSFSAGIVLFDHPQKQRRYAGKVYIFPDDRRLLVATDIHETAEHFKLMQWMGIASICFVMLVVFVSYLISVFVVKGTNEIADTARDIIKTGDLSRRLKVSSNWDDLGNMSRVLNLLLDRIESLMNGVRQVSDNIAHDLRRPLTRTRNKIESMADSETKQVVLDEFDHILSTFNSLLRISRIESEQQRSQFVQLQLDALLNDVIGFYQPLAEDRRIQLNSQLMSCQYFGDKDLLFQAFANLLDNAIKFTPEHGLIDVELRVEDDRPVVSVQDNGCGIDEHNQTKVFERFYRAEQSRTSIGSGLGLSLVKAVVELHHGSIEIIRKNPGTQFITYL
jgi:signal transduction histidine kinase